MTPQFLAAGHVTWDLHPQGRTLGGTAVYAALTAQRLGLRAAILTSSGPDLPIGELLPGIEVRSLSARQSTVFENRYDDAERVQRLLSRAHRLRPSDVPEEWRQTPLVLLGPIAQEVSPLLVGCFPRAQIGIVPQGWMRSWDTEGNIRPDTWRKPDPVLKCASLLVVSQHDLAPEQAESYASAVPTLAITLSARGSRLHAGGNWHQVPAFQVARVVDPTGAGDVYATALLIRMHEGASAVEAARFASCAASFVVEAVGTAGIPTRIQVQERLRTGRV